MSVLRAIIYASCLALSCSFASAAADISSAPVALLNHLAGTWVLRGTIAGKPTTHDVHAEWVLNHEYLQLHEVAREKNASGAPAYEAIIYIEWDAKAREYRCLWLDSTSGGGLSAQGIAHASEAGDSIPFIFTLSESDQIRTTFRYDSAADSWRWLIDNVTRGNVRQFANVKLIRAR
jgi:hypothetical protein